MATQDQNISNTAEEQLQFKEAESSLNASELLQSGLKGLEKLGGFQLIKGLIKGTENIGPRRKAVKNIFLTDSTYEDTRKKIKNELEMWIEVLRRPEVKTVWKSSRSVLRNATRQKKTSVTICSTYMKR